jgi:hypothetical protein
MERKEIIMDTIKGKDETGLLNPLFEARLQYQPGMAAITSPEGRSGDYLGSGDGTVNGPRLRGRVRWDLYEKVGPLRCETIFTGIVDTEDGAQIRFDAKGYGMVPDQAAPHIWHMVDALQFETTDEPYTWLNTVLAVWDGEFDMTTGRHRYHVYASSAI